jgi:hypothetical protein
MYRASLMLGCLLAQPSFGDVLHDQDNGPLTGIFGIPDSTEGGKLLTDGQRAWDLSLTVASHSVDDSKSAETLYLDGETMRFEFRYRIGITEKLELGVELPYVQHQAGQLDSLIDNWHKWFGLPQGHRPGREQDLLDFRYTDGNGTAIDVYSGSQGIGDARLFGGWQLTTSDRHQLALRFGAKFATGDGSHLHGSGGTDLSLGLAGDVNSLFGIQRLNGFYRLHAIHIGEPDLLADRYEEWASYVSAGIGFQVSERIQLRLQGASRSAMYDSRTRNLGASATNVTVGGNIRLFDNYELSLGVSEDADAGTAPDVAFQIALRYRGDQ